MVTFLYVFSNEYFRHGDDIAVCVKQILILVKWRHFFVVQTRRILNQSRNGSLSQARSVFDLTVTLLRTEDLSISFRMRGNVAMDVRKIYRLSQF